MLCGVASRLTTTVRRVDTVTRFGGDEFAVLLEDGDGPHDAMRVAHRIHNAFAAPVILGDHTFALSASIGIVIGAPSYREPTDVLRDVDTALYRAKALGRGHVVLFDTSMHDEVVARLEIEQDLRTAIAMGVLSIAYQPVVALDSGALTGFEALARWEHPAQLGIQDAKLIALSG